MLRSITIIVPIPPQDSHPNARCHWSKKARAVKQQRTDAHLAAIDAMRDWERAPRWKAATMHAMVHKPGNRSWRLDADGIVAWLKGTIDGFQDAQVIENDRHLVWESPEQILGDDAKERKVVITIASLD